MWLKSLYVKNFKSIDELNLEFTQGINVIFGENGTGKTNIIKAILKLLGPAYPGSNSFQKEDFFCLDIEREITIRMEFVEGADHFTLSWDRDDRGKLRLIYNYSGYITSDERDRFCPLHIPPNREIKDLPASSKWTPVGRIIFELSKIIEQNGAVTTQFKGKMAECVSILERSPEFSQFKMGIEAFSTEQMGSRGENVRIKMDLIDPKYILKTLQIFENLGNEKYNISEGGQGIQSNVTIAALRAFSEISRDKFFIIADEPEAYLHPLAQKALCKVFETIADRGTQIILTTHSPYFISPKHVRGLIKVWFEDNSTKCTKISLLQLVEKRRCRGVVQSTEQSTEARLNKMINLEVKEGLFAQSVVLCEGESESFSLEIWAEKEGIDFSKLGLAIVPSNGKFSMIDLAEFYEHMKIPVYLIFDSDSSTRDNRANHIQNNKWLLSFAQTTLEDFPSSVVSEKYCVMSPDFESVLRSEDTSYSQIEREINGDLGLETDRQKGIRARYVALKFLEMRKATPLTLLSLIHKIRQVHEWVIN
jgi:predicted ATP-dependent endonuclease of OLD family